MRIHNGAAECECSAGLHRNVMAARGDDVRLNERRHAKRVVHRCRFWNVHLLATLITGDAALNEDRRRLASWGANGIKRVALRRGHERLVCCIERHHQHVLEASLKDAGGGFSIRPDVELGGGGHVGNFMAATHDDEFRDPFGELRLLCHSRGDVGERTDRHQGDWLRCGAVGLNQPLHGTV